jgi:hypothetical protein
MIEELKSIRNTVCAEHSNKQISFNAGRILHKQIDHLVVKYEDRVKANEEVNNA